MLQQYMEALNKIKLLTLEEEHSLWYAYKEEGDSSARMKLIESYQPLVFKEVKPYMVEKMDYMDLIQEGNVGLIECVERYDYKKGIAFSLYAVHRVRGRIIDYLRREGRRELLLADQGENRWWEQLPDIGPSVEESMTHEALCHIACQGIKQLAPREQLVLEEVCVKGLPVKAVADRLATSQSYIYRLQRQGLKKLRSFVKGSEDVAGK